MAEVAVKDKIVEQLEHLLSITMDSIEGYKQSADNSPGQEFTALFTDYLIQRREYAEELKSTINVLGGDAGSVTGGTFSGLSRLWTHIKTSMSSDAERTALETCMADEKAVIAEYEKVLGNTTLKPGVREMLTDQKEGIERALTRSEQLARVYNT